MKTQPLLSHPFLVGLESAELEILSDYSMSRIFHEGEVIFQQGDIANRFYLIRSGQVRLTSKSPTGKPVEIDRIGAGDVLGWSWLFEPKRWQFDARAVGETCTLFFYATPLVAKFEEDPEFGYKLMSRIAEIMVRRLQKTREKLVGCPGCGEWK